MTRAMSRRRCIRISAAAAGFAVAPISRPAQAASSLVTWRGTKLGAVATMEIHHEDRNEAQRLISAACTEARRLERLFSPYLEDSALVELNRSGILVDPEAELVDLLTISQRLVHGVQLDVRAADSIGVAASGHREGSFHRRSRSSL